jgi:hypothetical protein
LLHAVLCHACHVAGFREAEAVAKAELESAAFSNVDDAEQFRSDLLNIARTTLSSKILTGGALLWVHVQAACAVQLVQPCAAAAAALPGAKRL